MMVDNKDNSPLMLQAIKERRWSVDPRDNSQASADRIKSLLKKNYKIQKVPESECSVSLADDGSLTVRGKDNSKTGSLSAISESITGRETNRYQSYITQFQL